MKTLSALFLLWEILLSRFRQCYLVANVLHYFGSWLTVSAYSCYLWCSFQCNYELLNFGDAHSSKLTGYQFHFFVFSGMLNEACRASFLLFAWDVAGMPVKANNAGWYFQSVIFDWMVIKASCIASHFYFFDSIQVHVCLMRLNKILFGIDVVGKLNIKKIASSHFNCHLGVIWKLVPTVLCFFMIIPQLLHNLVHSYFL